ncbi:MAG: ABC transporter substrate-binding protein [Bacteroidetes bacterium]|nr:MAG: ABC transporter substrate-binding protein [Bacteroidota bacterium]
MKKYFSMFMVLALFVGLLAGCGSAQTSGANKSDSGKAGKGNFVIGFANGYIGNTWRSQFVDNVKAQGEKLKQQGVIKDIKIANSNADVSKQLTQLNQMISEGVNALMIDPVSADSLGPIVAKAKAKGILVVITNDPAAYEGTYSVIGNNDAFWRIQAKWLANKLNNKGNIVQINGLPGNTADTFRRQAAKEVLGKTDIKVLAEAPGKWDESEAQKVTSTFLSTYNNIDGILTQDVMAEGILRAFDTAGKKPPVMTGDYTYSFLRTWAKTPDLDSIAVPYAPGVGVDALNITVQLLQGKKFNDSVLQANPLNTKLKNALLVDPPYVVTKTAQPNAPWMEGLKFTKAISVDDAVKIGEGKPGTAALDAGMTDDQIKSFFK